MNRKWIVAALVGTALPFPAFAQDTAPVDEENGEETIIVTAARTVLPPNALPLTIDVIGKDSLDQQIAIAGSITDAVSSLTPSFSPTRQKLSGAGETLRGRSPLYAINGIPQSTPLRDGSRDGFTIDGFFIDRVELIYGSNALQGIGGTGGIVNQVTVGAPKEEGLSGRVLLQGTADNGFSKDGLGGKAAGLVQYRAGRFDATFGAAYEKRGAFYDGQGRRIGINLTQGETQDSNTLSLFARLGYELSDTARLDLIASRFELKGDGDYIALPGNRLTGVPTSAVRGTPPGESAQNRTESVALSLTDTDLGGGNFVSQIFFNRSRDTFGGEVAVQATFQDPALAPVGTLFDQSQNRSRKLGAKFSYERGLPGFEDLTLTIGFDALVDRTEQALIATGRVWVPPSDFRSLAPFGQANLKLFDGVVRLAGGVRWENVQIKIDDFSTLASTTFRACSATVTTNCGVSTYGGVDVAGGKPKFSDLLINGGVIVEPWAGIRAYASYAEGFTVPDIGRITRAINTTGVDLDNFLDISPIISNNREIGIELKRGPLDATATYFWSSSDKGQLLIARPDRIFDVQRQRVEIEGLELNLRVALPIDGLRLGVGYAHLQGKYDSDSANPDGIVDTDLDGTNISPDRLNLNASYNKGPVSALVQTQFFLSKSFHGKANPDPRNNFGGYAITDASLRYETGIGGLSLSIQNLFDKFYIDYSSDTRLPTDNLAFFAGRGRTFTLGWDYRF
ncbi:MULTISPECIES: TonB-dependent receptor [unclassified Sphingopyxis]|uniref:TonB-dependent receptor n=1 Tax=unclassified Sphingopyxis TaxID=2614943 RepID=UPI000736333A|nr:MULTISPECIES: TonB-dependent receptor [unclassified Sphingopyxis]KTE41843.1 TonB-dependent receptor [Sphingopyxis sp. HIX]KTE84896.1 TonB-dependent receptor [Sphingopyxis sp. HXXIV]